MSTPPNRSPTREPVPGRDTSPEHWSRRLERTKLTPMVALLFFALLAAMSGAAAGVGWMVHALRHPAPSATVR